MLNKVITLRARAELSLHCVVNGDPTPFVHWTKNGSRHILRAQYSESNTTLTIASVGVADEGLYECVATNRAGNSSAKVEVNVQGKCQPCPHHCKK